MVDIEAAWQKAQIAWEAVGKPIPCYDPTYMAARAELAAAWNRASRKMTTDPDEGRRQIEAMKPPAIKVGDKVRLRAGGRVMEVIGLADYQNLAECVWHEPIGEPALGDSVALRRDVFPVRSLVLASD
jgi:hypothetical protein